MPIPSTNEICASWSRSATQSYERGFGALISVVMISSGTIAVSLAALGASVSYSDTVFRKHMRMQSALDDIACEDTAVLMRAKDTFASGMVRIAEFDCDVSL